MNKHKSKTKVTVRYAETDQMGIVYHGNYIQYFEIGRTDWLKQLGINYKDMEISGVILPVISLMCNFKKSALYDDELVIVTSLKKQPNVKIEFNYEIYNQNNELLCTGSTVLAFLNKKNKKPIRCPEYILSKIS